MTHSYNIWGEEVGAHHHSVYRAARLLPRLAEKPAPEYQDGPTTDSRSVGRQAPARAFTRPDRRLTFRLAVFLSMTPLETARNISLSAVRSALRAASRSPAVIASSTRRT